jgi:hypothetical protein
MWSAFFIYSRVAGATWRGKGNLMNLKDIIGKLPEAERAEAEKTIQDAITAANPLAGVTTKEQAAEFISKNALFKSAHDADISVKVDDHDKRFMADKLPKLLDAEIKKLTGPETDPIKLELAQIKAERATEKAEAIRDKQKAVALKLAAAEGIPVDDIERFLGDDDTKTTETTTAYAKRLKAWRDDAVESALKGKLGNNGIPKRGDSSKAMNIKDFTALSPKEQAAKMQEGITIVEE